MDPGDRLGRYTVLRKIATGGMAEVFLARQDGPAGFERPVALKRILPHLSTEKDLLAMFQEEARLAARLSHPNVVQIFDLGVEGGVPFLAMEHVFGESLAHLSQRLAAQSRRMPLELALHVGASLCLALHHAHSACNAEGPAPIIHRDVSPQNVLVGFEGEVKLADFGLAKAKGASAKTTTVGLIKGKVGYLSPEQVLGESVDARTDLFAAGIVLYELVTGQPPFKSKGKSMRAVLEAVTSDAPPPLPSALCGCPAAVDAVLVKAVSKDKARRFQSAAELLAALEDLQRRHALVAHGLALGRLMEEIFHPPHGEPFARVDAYLEERSSGAREPGSSPTEFDSSPTMIRKTDEPAG